MKKLAALLLTGSMLLSLAACGGTSAATSTDSGVSVPVTVSPEVLPAYRVITDSMDRNVEIPSQVERIV